jgi:hypothetical protein
MARHVLGICVALWFCAGSSRAATVWTYHNDNQRSGANLGERSLTPGAVGGFGLEVACEVDTFDPVQTQVLYVPRVNWFDGIANPLTNPGGPTFLRSVRNVAYVATTFNHLSAFDVDQCRRLRSYTGIARGYRWSTPSGGTRIPVDDRARTPYANRYAPTPVIDVTGGLIYFLYTTSSRASSSPTSSSSRGRRTRCASTG